MAVLTCSRCGRHVQRRGPLDRGDVCRACKPRVPLGGGEDHRAGTAATLCCPMLGVVIGYLDFGPTREGVRAWFEINAYSLPTNTGEVYSVEVLHEGKLHHYTVKAEQGPGFTVKPVDCR